MAAFPALKTGAIAQYPVRRGTEFATRVLAFIDGSEQRYREAGKSLHRWILQLDRLDEQELRGLEEFFANMQGRYGDFEFTDPWDGMTYASCSLESDELSLTLSGESSGGTKLIIRENPR